ncbi:MAG TPA: SOS response-associated peptidase [Candidatus Acidoferrum sp.]|nr:SOS response-associated peptidase [Candidatus Acidoferrum sp.]
MCGRFTLTDPLRIRAAYPRYRFEEFSEYRLPRFNIAPTQAVLGVLDDGSERVAPLEWGIDGRINARAETVTQRALPFRCIIFADGFYEWRGRKPVYYTMKDHRVFAFAGIFEPVTAGRPPCAIITVPANDLVAHVHDRMPAILADDQITTWLTPGDIPSGQARALIQPYDSSAMSARDVSMRVNDVRNDSPNVLVDDDPVQRSLF